MRSADREALGRLAVRHVNFVYGVARREVSGDSHLAEDVTQAVFLVLAQRAGRVNPASLAGWLFTTTRNVAANALKAAARRRHHERVAASLTSSERVMHPADSSESEHLQHHLHAALAAQRESDRSIVLMRYTQGLGVEQIDLYQMHWPAEDGTPVEDYWQMLLDLKEEGKVRAVGLSNHKVDRLEIAERLGHVDTLQPPFSLVRRDAS